MEAWLGLIGTLLGAVLGWGLSETSKTLARKRQALQNLESAAFVCLDRLMKIQRAKERDDQEQTKEEIWHLGRDLDRYRDAIASTRHQRSAHWPLYKQTRPLLLEHDLNTLRKLIGRYEQKSGVALAPLSSKEADADDD